MEALTNKTQPLPMWPVALALLVAVVSMAGTIIYATLGVQNKVPVTIDVFITTVVLQGLTNWILLILLWRRHKQLPFMIKVFAVGWGGIMLWFSLPAPLIMLLTGIFNAEQMAWLNFAWSWQMCILAGSLVGGYTLLLALPINSFLRHPQRPLKHPQRLYTHVIHYPLFVMVGYTVISVIGYLAGGLQLSLLSHLPTLETVKIIVQGLVSSLLISVYYYLAYDLLLQPVRHTIEDHYYHLQAQTRRRYSRRITGITMAITLGSALIGGLIVFRSYQLFIEEKLVSDMSTRLKTVSEQLAALPSGSDLELGTAQAVAAVQLGASSISFVDTAPAALQNHDISLLTQNFITNHSAGLIIDNQNDEKVVGFLTNPLTGEKIVSLAYMHDFSGPLFTGLQYFSVASLLVVVITALMTSFASGQLSAAIRKLSVAVREAQHSKEGFSFDTHTADEMEDLAHAFSYYINQSLELQHKLEDKVKELKQAVERLQELDKVKSEFISIASHQLRTPLTVIRWSFHTMLEESAGKLSNDQKSMMSAGLKKALFMVDLVNNLLDIARIEENSFTLDYSEVALDRLLQEIINDLKEQAEVKQITMNFQKPEKRLPTLLLDSNKIHMALTNVIDNAIKYSKVGGKVEIAVSLHDSLATITVTDTGIGIPKQLLYRIFTRFFRSPNAVTLHTDGSGLGLYIAKTIIERHGGVISLQSEEHKGTKVTINLPTTKKKSS